MWGSEKMILIDTSALLAILAIEDIAHKIAKRTWDRLVLEDISIHTNQYLLIEAYALIQNRLGMRAIRDLHEKLLPMLNVEWITSQQHQNITENFLLANRRSLSLVDCSSFATMRRLGIRKAFTFDPHFAEQGFEVIPEQPTE